MELMVLSAHANVYKTVSYLLSKVNADDAPDKTYVFSLEELQPAFTVDGIIPGITDYEDTLIEICKMSLSFKEDRHDGNSVVIVDLVDYVSLDRMTGKIELRFNDTARQMLAGRI